AAATVDRLAPCNRQQPGAKRALSAKPIEVAIRGDERVLRCVFRVGVRPEHGERGAIHGAAMPIDQRAERGGIAAPRPGYQVGIVHTTCRHASGRRGWGAEPGGRRRGAGTDVYCLAALMIASMW